ncbi:MAG: aminotransferase class I/II-fold pyridoxal phosphate-dependent enzyme [Candidatus Caenarcaniphilales bacterium]|nr:aminotransferase class I/II-fold pyridoxal phosphate-dependent enzyme [Candidatus Caenarcaniphilales bacterium]
MSSSGSQDQLVKHFRKEVKPLSVGQIIAKVQRVQEAIKLFKSDPIGLEPINAVVGVLKIKNSDGVKETWIPDVMDRAHQKVSQSKSKVFDYGSAFVDPHLAINAGNFFIGKENVSKLSDHGYFVSTGISAGGTAGLSHVLNIFNKGYPWVLAANAWGGYRKIREHLAGFLPSLHTFEILDTQGNLNVQGFGDSLKESLIDEKGATIILNLPYDNPTGLKFSNRAMTELAKEINWFVEGGKEITLVLDTAYDKFGFEQKESLDNPLEFIHDFMDAIDDKTGSKFKVVIVPSFSKNHASYGLRMAFPTIITKSEELAKVFPDYIASAARGSYSSASNASINTVKEVLNDPDSVKEVEEYLLEASKLLSNRLEKLIVTFEKFAEKHNLQFKQKDNSSNLYEIQKSDKTIFELVIPQGGFFATMRANTLEEANRFNQYLEDNLRLYMTNFDRYVRIPICSLTDQDEMNVVVERLFEAMKTLY